MNPNEHVTGVTETGFITANQLIKCQNCEKHVHPDNSVAVKPKNHTVMLCENCVPKQRKKE